MHSSMQKMLQQFCSDVLNGPVGSVGIMQNVVGWHTVVKISSLSSLGDSLLVQRGTSPNSPRVRVSDRVRNMDKCIFFYGGPWLWRTRT